MRLQTLEEIAARAAATTPAEHLDTALHIIAEAEAALKSGNTRHVLLALRSMDATLRNAQRKLVAADAERAEPRIIDPEIDTAESDVAEIVSLPGAVVDLAASRAA